MFFVMRRTAIHVVEEMGLKVRSTEGNLLVDLIVTGAKQLKEMVRGTTKLRISDEEFAFMSVAVMRNNKSALDALEGKGLAGEELLKLAKAAGRRLAVRKGFTRVVEQSYDKHPDDAAETIRSRPMSHQVVSQFRVQTIDECLSTARGWTPEMRKAMARDLAVTLSQIDLKEDDKKKGKRLFDLMKFANDRKMQAENAGNDGPDDPLWNVSTCIEMMLGSVALTHRYLELETDEAAIREAIELFIRDNPSH